MSAEEFNGIWLPLAGRFYRVAYYILESQEDAEDAVQDLFARLWKLRSTLGGIKNPVAFGITSIRNICLDKIRSRSSSRTVSPAPESFTSLPDPDADIDRLIVDKENMGMIRSCMARLPSIQRKVLEMRVFENIPYPEIARRTGLSEVNVRVKLSNARKNLKRMIEHEDD